jgi:hypothetical protein
LPVDRLIQELTARVIAKMDRLMAKGGTTSMNLRKHVPVLLLSIAMATGAMALTQEDQQSPKQDMKDAGHATKDAAKDAGHATQKTAKKVGHKTKKTTKKVVNKGAQKTEEGAQKVEDKTQPN